MNKVNFIFGVHNHQPVGNFDHVFEDMYRKSYEPFARVLHRHPGVKCAVHTTGPLLEWMRERHPEYLTLLREMGARGQVEFFTGGMYEPILSILPDRDKLGQVRMLTETLRRELKAEAKGMWVAERVWEPHLTRTLAEAGVSYIVMDDAHFKAVGLGEAETFGYYLMEEQGRTVGVFPISEKMRYMVPFHSVQETLDYLRSVADEKGDRCVVLMDDGEKFGGWPDTYKWVYEEGWLEKFFTALEENRSWLNVQTFAEYVRDHRPLGNISLPTGSYTEMGEWSLPPGPAAEYESVRKEVQDRGEMPRYERYLKGGFWRNFLTKYAESGHLHKKMLWVSDKVEAARLKVGKKGTAKKKAVLDKAARALYRGQCNCPYWHGVFGGLYLNHLRFGVYRELLEAEKLADSLLPQAPRGIRVTVTDFNKDGRDEVVVESAGYHAVLEPSSGGVLTEVDFLPRPVNLSDTLTRRPEAYHAKLLALAAQGPAGDGVASIHERVRSKEEGLEKKLHYDPARRVSLTEHFLPLGTTVDDMMTSRYRGMGDFRSVPFGSEAKEPDHKGGPAKVKLSGNGLVDGEPVRLVKKLRFTPGPFGLRADYSIEHLGTKPLHFLFFTEWNLTLLAGDAADRVYYVKGRELSQPRLCSIGEEPEAVELGMRDGWLGLEIQFKPGKPARFWRYPVETVSQSEGGFERVYQGSCLMLGWDVPLAPGGAFEVSVSTEVKETTGT